MNKFDYKKLTPFKWFVLENFPFIEADFDALTNWQLFCKLGKEMNKIINSENVLGTQVENVTNAFIELQNYVNNYFDNLDIQEEVNTKLDEMTENGSLLLLFQNYLPIITPEMFGAKGDGETDDTLSIQNAINNAQLTKSILLFCNKTYIVSSLLIRNTININGNGALIKSINNTNDYIIKLENRGITQSLIKNLKIDGNNQNVKGLYLFTQNYQDCYTILDNIEVYNCLQNGIHITGNSSNSSVRELKIINCIEHNNLNGIYSNSMTDSYIINNTAYGNKQHGIYLSLTASIKISNSKCFMNGKETNDVIPLERIPASAFNITSDTSPITGKNYYTRTGNGNWQTPYIFTLFTGTSFVGGQSYYELTGNYKLHGHGMYLDRCDSI